MVATQPIPVPSPNGALSPNSHSASPPSESFVNYGSLILDHHMQKATSSQFDTSLPVECLPGEVLEEGADFLSCRIFLTNYRIIIIANEKPIGSLIDCPHVMECIPIACMDTVDSEAGDHLTITCKDARIVKVSASSTEQALAWYKKLATRAHSRSVESLFTWSLSRELVEEKTSWLRIATPEWQMSEQEEFKRMSLDPDYFNISPLNQDYSVCPTYPRQIIIPTDLSEKEIQDIKDFRFLGRLPAVTWHCKEKSTLLLRSSQPKSSFFWRNSADERLFELVNEYTKKKTNCTNIVTTILDARSYAAAWGNRAKGGGFECTDYYPCTTTEFLGLPNIHYVRYTFTQLKHLFTPPVDQSNFLHSLQATNWFNNMAQLLHSANRCADLLTVHGHNVLVHCSDGWDRTTQLVTLTKLLLDPFFRTVKGIELLISRDWIAFGHKFCDRNGMTTREANERSPVFFQWLDCVHQIVKKYPTEFEFTMAYLVKLACHVHSGLFTSFCFNSLQEMEMECTKEGRRPLPVWSMLNGETDEGLVNAIVDQKATRLVAPDTVQSLHLWNEVFKCDEIASLLKVVQKEEVPGDGKVIGEECITEKSMMKSRSTDSIPSELAIHAHPRTDIYDNECPMNEGKNSRRGTRTSGGDTSIQREQSSHDLKEMVDKDGLIRFVDETQQSVRRKIKKEMEKLEGGERIRRRRQTSELTDIEKMAIEDTFSLDSSDASIIDGSESNTQPGKAITMAVNDKACALCKCSFWMVGKPRKICKSCGRAVCDGCSCNKYMEVIDGRQTERRACRDCYEKMQLPEESPQSRVSPNSSPPFYPTSQAVKG